MDRVDAITYQDYLRCAADLEERLAAIYGHKKATTFFRRMDEAGFDAICRGAPVCVLKRQWLRQLQERARCLAGKTGKAA